MPRHPRLGALRTRLSQIHPVNRSLLLFMAVLLLQSVYGMFAQSGVNALTEEIDVILHTSAASIFGYLLSANFINHVPASQTAVSTGPAAAVSTVATAAAPSSPRSRIGFSAEASGMEPGGVQGEAPPLLSKSPDTNRLQVITATVIGLFCLAVLLILRNVGASGEAFAASDSVSATVVQFRDFISGCVGFLIGFPTQTDTGNST